jgi:hypothetical protein
MIENMLIKYAATIGQNGLFIIIMGWCIMNIRSLAKAVEAMSEALSSKASKEMCDQKHSDLDKHMIDLKDGNKDISKKLSDLYNFLLKA